MMQSVEEFAEQTARELLENGATEAAVIIRNEENGTVVTNYYNTSFELCVCLIGGSYMALQVWLPLNGDLHN